MERARLYILTLLSRLGWTSGKTLDVDRGGAQLFGVD
jgi:hypothetical protein